jgi:uncharacterized membrane protein YtjA (UPF0391 family)
MGSTLILAVIALLAALTGFGGLTLAEVLDLFQK